MGEETEAEAVVGRAEPGLGEIDAGVVGRNEVPREVARRRARLVVKDAAAVQ